MALVVPVRNYAKYLPKCLETLLGQSSEIIVWDDASTDNSYQIAQKYPVRAYRNETRKGLGATRNLAIAAATAPFILNVDADDWVAPDYVSSLLRAIDNHPVAWCDVYDVFLEKVCVYRTQRVLDLSCGAIFRKSRWEQIGGYREDLPRQENHDFWNRYGREGFHVERALYFYRRHDKNMSNDKELVAKTREALDADNSRGRLQS